MNTNNGVTTLAGQYIGHASTTSLATALAASLASGVAAGIKQ